MKNNLEQIKRVGVFLVIVIALASLVFAVSQTDFFSLYAKPGDTHKLVENVSMKIVSPDWNIAYMNVNTNNATVADLLFECASHYNFEVEVEYWRGYDSYFIESINGIENGEGDKYWQFYVNGRYADVGCSKYILYNNDVVEWRFESSSWI